MIGASAGGVEALTALVAGLAIPLPAPILIVLHIGAHSSLLPSLLNVAGVTPAKHGEDGEDIRPGQIYVAPPDRHMLVVEGHIRLTRDPKENWARPAIDPLFRSVAESFGPAAIGIILTGNLNDGAAGLYEIKWRGGVAIVQDPDDAANPDMPRSAAAHVELDYCLPLAAIPPLLKRLVTEEEGVVTNEPQEMSPENGRETVDGGAFDRPVTVTCPDCGGALRRSAVGALVKYACHIGHVYTAEAMAAAQFDEMERVMRSAERILNERAEFCRQMAERSAPSGEAGCEVWRAASREALTRAYALRDFVEQDWIMPRSAAFAVQSRRLESDA
ncbi:MAG TPA: chemotaxis protein CheB [Caulobacteraceae bacterium]|nr:chemotaxis protein CheB [Caulobacteraceae bacterium]